MKLILEKESVNFEKKNDKLRILRILINVNKKKNWHKCHKCESWKKCDFEMYVNFRPKMWNLDIKVNFGKKCEFLRKIWILDKRAIMWILDVKVNFGQKCEFWT